MNCKNHIFDVLEYKSDLYSLAEKTLEKNTIETEKANTKKIINIRLVIKKSKQNNKSLSEIVRFILKECGCVRNIIIYILICKNAHKLVTKIFIK